MIKTIENDSEVVDMETLNEEMEREIAVKELHYQRWSRGVAHLKSGEIAVTEEMSGMMYVDRMEKVARQIAMNDGRATKTGCKAVVKGRYKLTFEITSLGKEILHLCRNAIPVMEELYPGCRRRMDQSADRTLTPYNNRVPDDIRTEFNPYISVMLRACQCAVPILRPYDEVTDPRRVRIGLERLVRFVRRVCRSKRFKYIESNYARKELDGFRSCCHYMAAIFANYSKLLIMRVDLYFLPEDKGWANTVQASKSVRRFLRALRESRIVPDVRAWVCRRENGFRRGIHLHILVAIDGHKHREAATFSKIIGEAWADRFSDGHGSYFNCWARRKVYRFNCLGLVHITDRKMLIGIREAIRYMTKGACYVTTGHPRNLWKGIMPTPCDVVKRGAPRKAESDMSLVNDILVDGCKRKVAPRRVSRSCQFTRRVPVTRLQSVDVVVKRGREVCLDVGH